MCKLFESYFNPKPNEFSDSSVIHVDKHTKRDMANIKGEFLQLFVSNSPRWKMEESTNPRR